MTYLNELVALSQKCQTLQELINADTNILEVQNNQFIKQI